jgi:signal transduction histidine kinase
VKKLLAFSRKQVLEPQVVDLNSVLAELEPMLRRLIGEDVLLVVELARELGNVNADPAQIEQMIVNLAVNARDAMPDGGMLTIESANVELPEGRAARLGVSPGRYVMLRVADDGSGMDEETRSRAFEPFFDEAWGRAPASGSRAHAVS